MNKEKTKKIILSFVLDFYDEKDEKEFPTYLETLAKLSFPEWFGELFANIRGIKVRMENVGKE